MVNIICKRCNNEFVSTSKSQKVCENCRKCKQCGELVKRNSKQFCSQRCASIWSYNHSEAVKHRFHGIMYTCTCKHCGTIFENNIKNTTKCVNCKRIRSKSERNYGREQYKSYHWKKSVKLRDNYECQECHEKPQIVHAHHIKPWKKYPEVRFDVSNGITLCESCHKSKHTHID